MLRKRLPSTIRYKISWFHSEMTEEYREQELEKLRKGEIWGICATDSFGMVCLFISHHSASKATLFI